MHTLEDDSVRLDLPGNGRYLDVVASCLDEMLRRVPDLAGVDDLSQRIHLAVHEACANIVEHSYDPERQGRIRIEMTLFLQPHRLVVDLFDTGKSFDFEAMADVDLDEIHIRGYGLHLIRSIMDEVAYDAGEDGNHWRLVKNL